MKTTLDIDDDLLQAAKELALQEGSTVGQVISNLARRGLVASTTSYTNLRGGVPLLPSRGKVVTLKHVQRLQDQEGT